jgi:TPR repeat protein
VLLFAGWSAARAADDIPQLPPAKGRYGGYTELELLPYAERGNVEAQAMLGDLYVTLGDYARAVPMLRKAAVGKNAKSQTTLGRLYYLGEGVGQDFSEAVFWLRRGADQGNDDAQAQLGMAYYEGNGVAQDYARAAKLFAMAADAGNVVGLVNLGLAYQEGRGVPRDALRAVALYRKASKTGNPVARFNLALAYADGRGVPKSLIMAYAIFNMTAPSLQQAGRVRDLVAKDMKPGEIELGQSLTRAFQESTDFDVAISEATRILKLGQ